MPGLAPDDIHAPPGSGDALLGGLRFRARACAT
jgi:hypothetical protein